jgi:aldose sugar dehydrogenase
MTHPLIKLSKPVVAHIRTHLWRATLAAIFLPVAVLGLPGTVQAGMTVTTVADGLQNPWDVAWTPDGDIFLTERPGRVRVIHEGVLQSDPILTVSTQSIDGSGLQGIAVDPNFADPDERFVYLYYTFQFDCTSPGCTDKNRLVRYRYNGSRLVEPLSLIDNIAGCTYHNGGRVKFGPDGKLYLTTGDGCGGGEKAQDRSSTSGKILRLEKTGEIPSDNPFTGSYTWASGLRDPQGLAWSSDGTLYSTDHGPSGVPGEPHGCCFDELNRIIKGGNYGWPLVFGDQTAAGMISPLIHSGPDVNDTWAPSGMSFDSHNILWIAELRGQAVRRVVFNGNGIKAHREVGKGLGRFRTIAFGPDGIMYIATSGFDRTGHPDQLLTAQIVSAAPSAGDSSVVNIGSTEVGE